MISVIITSYKESKTIGRAIESFQKQISKEDEIMVVAPDEETLAVAKKIKLKDKRIVLARDSGKGKPAALNLAVKKARGEILILTDGDVHVSQNALPGLLNVLQKKEIGAVSGRPISIDSRKNIYGFWAYLLTEVAHERRIKALKEGKRFFCSGYLFAIRKSLFPELPEELFSEDGYISHKIYEKRKLISYEDKSEVYVKYPDNFSDWIKQKKRSAGGYEQMKKMFGLNIRSFRSESFGALDFFKHVSNLKEFAWLVALFLARVYLWFAIYRDVRFKKQNREKIWERVESTK